MHRFNDSLFEGELEIVATLSGRAIEASINELRKRDELTMALRGALGQGVSIDELSASSGLAPQDIRSRVDGELFLEEDIDALTGVR